MGTQEKRAAALSKSISQIDFKATRLILRRLLVNNPVNNPFSLSLAALLSALWWLWKVKGKVVAFHANAPHRDNMCDYFWHTFSSTSTQSVLTPALQIVFPSLSALQNWLFNTNNDDNEQNCCLDIVLFFRGASSRANTFRQMESPLFHYLFFFVAHRELSHPSVLWSPSFTLSALPARYCKFPLSPVQGGVARSIMVLSLIICWTPGRPAAHSPSLLKVLELSANQRWNN